MFFEKLIKYSEELNITKIPLIVKYENNAKVECEENLFLMLKKCRAI